MKNKELEIEIYLTNGDKHIIHNIVMYKAEDNMIVVETENEISIYPLVNIFYMEVKEIKKV